MGRAASSIADEIVITSDNPRGEEPKAIIEDILSGIENKKPFIECDRRKAIHLALSSAAADDVVLVCGKGHETTQEIAGEKYPFDDREEIRAYAP
jgi:UDP-N-acetylmuramyl tripeptide synthase